MVPLLRPRARCGVTTVSTTPRPGSNRGRCRPPEPLLHRRAMTISVRHDWTLPEVRALHDLPLFELMYRAQTVHREAFTGQKIQLCSLLSVKTGGCPEDCAYCPQA